MNLHLVYGMLDMVLSSYVYQLHIQRPHIVRVFLLDVFPHIAFETDLVNLFRLFLDGHNK